MAHYYSKTTMDTIQEEVKTPTRMDRMQRYLQSAWQKYLKSDMDEISEVPEESEAMNRMDSVKWSLTRIKHKQEEIITKL